MENLFEGLDLPEEKVSQLNEAFDKAVMAKSVELMETQVEKLVEEKEEALREEYEEKVSNLEDTLDGYLQSVVEEFMEENAPTYEAQIEEAKVKSLLEHFDAMLTVAGIDMLKIQEAADESSAESEVARLSEKVSEMQDELMEARKEADKYLKAGVIMEMKQGLTDVEASKFEKLAEMVVFTRDESFVKSLETIKESILDKREETTGSLGESFKPSEEPKDSKVLDFSKYV